MANQENTLNTTLLSALDLKTSRSRNNAAGAKLLLETVRAQEKTIAEGGGAKAIESQHAKKRLAARERVALLLDPGT